MSFRLTVAALRCSGNSRCINYPQEEWGHEPDAMAVYEVIVVGAGVEGSSTAFYLASRGTKKVLLLEQFEALHVCGSSHGPSRTTRRAYRRRHHVQMMDEAYRLWADIEKESGNQLYIKTGVMVFGKKDLVQCFVESLAAIGVPHKVMSGKEANERYPMQLQLPSDYIAVYDGDGGILRANKALAAMQELFVRHGGELLDRCKVVGIVPGPVVTVQTEKGDFKAKRVILTVGPWTNSLLLKIGPGLSLPLQVQRTEVLYWKVKNPELYAAPNFPCLGAYTDIDHFYALPAMEYPGLFKVCLCGGTPADPDERDRYPHSTSVSMVDDFIQKHFRGVSRDPAIVEFCMFTMTPDKDFILDRHPLYRNIIIGAGFSGHGFKLSPVVGKILGQLALDQTPSYDMSPFKIGRFDVPKSAL